MKKIEFKKLENIKQLKLDVFNLTNLYIEVPIISIEKKVQENKEQVSITYLEQDLIDFGEIVKIK